MMKRSIQLCFMGLMAVVLLSGCATPPRPLPTTYLNTPHSLSVQVTRCPDSPSLAVTEQGGLIGVAVNAPRKSNMKAQMEGIRGDTVKELLQQQIRSHLQQKFQIADSSSDLALNVNVTKWGWFLPTTLGAVKTGSYEYQIIGTADILDLKSGKKRVCHCVATAKAPLGDKPTAELCQTSLLTVCDDFARQVSEFILTGKNQQKK